MLRFTLPVIPKLTLPAVIDILAVTVLIYNFFLMVRGRRAAHVLSGIWVLLIAYLIAVWARLELLRTYWPPWRLTPRSR